MTAVFERSFVVRWADLNRWVIPARLLLTKRLPEGWRFVRVGETVKQVEKKVKVEAEKEYKMVGVKWYGEGTFHRETVKGESLSAAYVTPLIPGALVYNRLFAWKGSFAIVPESYRGSFVSSEFPQFVVDEQYILPHYLYLFFMCNSTIRAVDASSVGSAAVSRNRFKEEMFIDFDTPLPPISVQRSIVARWESIKNEIEQARDRVEQQEAEIPRILLNILGIPLRSETTFPKVFSLLWEDLERWSVNYLARITLGARDVRKARYPLKLLGEIAQVSYGIQKSPANRPGQHAHPYLRVANVQRGKLDLSEIKYFDVPSSELEVYRLQKDDLLVCEGNSADLVGRPAIWNDEIPDCVHQNHILRVRVNPIYALPEFVLEYMQTSPVRNYFRAHAKFTTNLASINSNDLRELQIPLPSLELQSKILQEVKERRREIAREQKNIDRLAAALEEEIEEMILGTRPVPEINDQQKLSA